MPASSYSIRDWNDVERSFRVVASTSRPVRCFEWNEQTQKLEEYFEALEGWSVERFSKNPIIIESHDAKTVDAGIGLGSEIKQTADGGLELKITLASLLACPRTSELENKIKEGILRGVSVGFTHGERTDEVRNGRTVRVYRNNELDEVSLCLIPKDEDALVEAEAEDGPNRAQLERLERISNAGRHLASARKVRTDASDDASEVNRFDFLGTVSKFTRTQVGGIRVPARLTRTGILEYKRPDGTIRRELRLPSEVFNTDSLSTLAGATVTDLDHHRGLLTAENWRDATLGHTEEVRADGDFVAADLVINDAATVADIENGRLHDISCGYSCRLDAEPGVWNGQPYDVIQRRIRYNHVAVLPKGKGRAGSDVALRLDAKDADSVEADNERENTMAVPNETVATKRVIRIDGKDFDYGSETHVNYIEEAHKAELAKREAATKELQTRCDTLEARCDAAEKAAKKSKEELEEEQKGEKARARRRSREKLLRRAIRVLATENDEDEEEKMDALDDLTDRELMLKVIRADANYADDKALEAKSDDYITAIFEIVSKNFTRTDGVDNIVKTIERVKRTDMGDKDPADESRKKMNKEAQEAWRKPLN